MATYVMSDIHGCIDEVKEMLEKINFTDKDRLIFAGDYVDRGPKNYETLEWIKNAPKNITFLMGNHDVDFIKYIDILSRVSKDNISKSDVFFAAHMENYWFDHYGTLRELYLKNNVSLERLIEYKNIFKTFKYFKKLQINNKKFIIVHAGYIEEKDFIPDNYHYYTIEDYYVWARDEAYTNTSGIKDTTIIAGHTPTVIKREFCYTEGKVYKQYNKSNNCTLYDIDCGCTYAYGGYKESFMCKLACIRLEDEQVFYVQKK